MLQAENSATGLTQNIKSSFSSLHVVLIDSVTGLPYNASGGAGGGATIDRELVVETYRVINAFAGASVNDLLTQVQVLDVTGAPSTVVTIWRNQTTGTDLVSAPSFANIELAGGSTTAITNALGAVADAAATTDTGSFSVLAFLKRGMQNWTSLLARLPTLGAKASSGSVSTTPATDAVYTTTNININPSQSFTRPADTTVYASGDTVANSTTAGSVTPLTLTAARVAAGAFMVHRLSLRKSGTSVTNAAFRVHLFKTSPTSASGDNAAISMTGSAGYVGYVDIVIDQAFTDGAVGFSSLAMSDTIVSLASGTSLYALLEARAAYTPISAEVFTLTAEITQD